MKKVSVLALFFALTVLAGVVFAAGGDSSDPLISLSYLQGTFRDKVDRSIDSKLDSSDKAAYAQAESALRAAISAAEANVGGNVADTFTERRLKQGDILSGATGLQVIVFAGNVTAQFSSGAVVDVTAGSEIQSGAALTANHRYLVAEDTSAQFTVVGKTAVVSYCGPFALTLSSTADYPAMASSLKTLGLFRGSDTAYGEGFDLEKAPTRMEALIMLIRLLGEESEALTCTAYQPFADVPDWAEPYAAYAYAKGYTNGVEPTMFGTTMSASAEMYTEFLLRALRYSSTAQTDISNAPERAYFAGVLTSGEVSIPAIIGFISLFGIATRNGMLLISHYNHLQQEEGYGVYDSVIRGSLDRLNPILMTALSSALALIPLAVNGDLPGNEIQSPMATVILGGLLSSTFLNGFIIPIIYLLMNKEEKQTC